MQWRLPIKRTPASGDSVMTHRTEEELSEGEEEAVANEIQPGHRIFSSGRRFLLQLYYKDPFPMSLAPLPSCLLSWPLFSLPRSTQYPILLNLWFPSTGMAPALLSFQPLGPQSRDWWQLSCYAVSQHKYGTSKI